MIIKKEVLKKAMIERFVVYTPEIRGCDYCKKETDALKKFVIFKEKISDDAIEVEFCSWTCWVKFLKEYKEKFSFIRLPNHLDSEDTQEFLNLLK